MFEIFNTIFKYKEKQSPDKLGKYPEQVHVAAMPERRYLWTSRMLVIFSCLSISLNMMLGSTLYLMLPQRTVYPKLLQINKYFSQLEQTQPDERIVPVTDLVAEQHITNYIILRHTISDDYDELLERWGKWQTLYWYSSPEVYKKFADNDVKFNIMQFRDKSLQRNVIVEWVRPLTLGLWQAQFLMQDYYPESDKPQTTIWRANLRIAYKRIPFRNKDDVTKNPFGFVVENYSLGYVGTPETSAHYLETAKELTEQNYRNR